MSTNLTPQYQTVPNSQLPPFEHTSIFSGSPSGFCNKSLMRSTACSAAWTIFFSDTPSNRNEYANQLILLYLIRLAQYSVLY